VFPPWYIARPTRKWKFNARQDLRQEEGSDIYSPFFAYFLGARRLRPACRGGVHQISLVQRALACRHGPYGSRGSLGVAACEFMANRGGAEPLVGMAPFSLHNCPFRNRFLLGGGRIVSKTRARGG
jgi:hypothetical protein